MDIFVDSTGDVSVPSTGVIRLTSGLLETTKQRLTIKIRTFLGEWFLDTRVGVPYFRDILIKNPNLSIIRVIFRRLLLGDEAVDSVPKLELEFDSASRKLFVTFDAVLTDGSILSATV